MLPRTYKLAWIGQEDACSYLLERFEQCCASLDIQPCVTRRRALSLDDADDLCNQDRLVLVSPTRSDYPDDAVHWLTTRPNIVPWGVVTSSWHTGSRRSGQGVVAHWQQPWFRWWDSWSSWFFPEYARPNGTSINAFAPIVMPVDYASPTASLPTRDSGKSVAIVGSCPLTVALLSQQAEHAGWQASVYRSTSELLDCHQRPDAILWDDSLLACLPGVDHSQTAIQSISELTHAFPGSSLIVSVDLVHLYLWSGLQKQGCVDLLVKPAAGLGLSNCLWFRATKRPAFHWPCASGSHN